MKIIERKEPHATTARLTCSKCKSVLEVTRGDIQSDRDGSYIKCPVCSEFNGVPAKLSYPPTPALWRWCYSHMKQYHLTCSACKCRFATFDRRARYCDLCAQATPVSPAAGASAEAGV